MCVSMLHFTHHVQCCGSYARSSVSKIHCSVRLVVGICHCKCSHKPLRDGLQNEVAKYEIETKRRSCILTTL